MNHLIKRLLDILGALFLISLLWPIMLTVLLLVEWRLGSPALFRQARVGKSGAIFELVKFRTMTSATDASGTPLPDAQRLTAFGKLLRATSLDELPQLWNILVGDMSFVGPRPLLPEYLPFYTPRENTRHTMRPGITGLAQVSGRNALGWDERLEFDVQYIEQFTLLLDLKILWRTVLVVLKRTGITAEGQATMERLDRTRKGNV